MVTDYMWKGLKYTFFTEVFALGYSMKTPLRLTTPMTSWFKLDVMGVVRIKGIKAKMFLI
jgi:hypothetical protein